MNFKQMVIGNAIGRLFGSSRDAIDVLQTAFGAQEKLGTIANDQLAAFLIARISKPETKFIDVGAHIGSVIAAVKHHNASVIVIAIEAVPEKAAALTKKFPTVEVHGCAVGDQDGTVPFYINTKRSGYSALVKPSAADQLLIKQVQVKIKRLDDLVAALSIDAMKIDVEGAELEVLRGSRKILSSCRPTIMFESAPGDDGDSEHKKEALWQFFNELSYTVLIPNRVAHNGDGLSREGFTESHVYPRRTTNYFAIPNERRIELRDRARELLGIKEMC